MNTYTTEQLQEVLTLHRAWLNGAAEGRRADLTGAVLTGADLTSAVLRNAVLTGAVLTGADLRNADLTGAVLTGAVLTGAVLRNAVLTGADLTGADLTGAVLTGADLRNAVLTGADLTGAVLRNAVLTGADLRNADLTGAVLTGADLTGAIGLPIASDAPARLLAVARAALASPDALEMGSWHKCDTTHCICGWAEHLGGPLAELIIYTQGNDVGGLMLLGVEAHAHFYKTNDEARAFLQSVIDQAGAVA